MNWYKKIILAGLPIYNVRDFVKKLQKEYGVQFIRHGKGDDQVWGIPGTNRGASIPFAAGSKTLNPDTMMDILRNLRIPLQGFKKKQHKAKPVEPVPEKPISSIEAPEWQKAEWYQKQQGLSNANSENNEYKIAKKWKDKLPGGRADNKKPSDFDRNSVEEGKEIEFEHTDNPDIAREIAIDHLEELEDYYDKEVGLPDMEKKLEKIKKGRN
jgi:hypothetical protein